jgi:hypothetical protein
MSEIENTDIHMCMYVDTCICLYLSIYVANILFYEILIKFSIIIYKNNYIGAI